MTDHIEEKSSRSQLDSIDEPITSTTELTSNETIAALINGAPLFDPDTVNTTTTTTQDDSPPHTRRRSSVSIIQALVNSSHLLTTNDARKR